jgi:hypothetical protein
MLVIESYLSQNLCTVRYTNFVFFVKKQNTWGLVLSCFLCLILVRLRGLGLGLGLGLGFACSCVRGLGFGLG